MGKSVEHILLRLLTPAVLLFLAAHLAAGVLDGRAAREQPAGGRSLALFLEEGSGAAKTTRPSKVQWRKLRNFDQQSATPKPRCLVVAAAYSALLLEEGERQEPPAHALTRIAVPSLFAHARTRNPRDPPGLLT
jgi:hypothetical protein